MDILIRKGSVQDTEALICFLEDIRNGMKNKEWFYLDPADNVREYMSNGTMQLWLAMDGTRIAAIFDTLTPGLAAYNYGHDLGFSEEELMRVVHLDTAAVHPDYRGLGLQRALIQNAQRELSGSGEKILLCTVHPENRYSLENVQKQGYIIQKKLEKYGSVRYILRKDIL